MPFTINDVVPWGRSYEEYVAMFDLTDDELALSILGCADGPSSFNSEMSRRGGKVISADPLYRFGKDQISRRIKDSYDKVMEQTCLNADEFVWTTIHSVEELGRIWMSAMQAFLDDYELGLKEGRYVPASLPTLPFPNGQFQLTLCSHFLFLYSEQLGFEFHEEAVLELCRVSDEVRIFPLLQLGATPSPHVAPIMSAVKKKGYVTEIVKVLYEFQRGGDKILRIRKS
jgi:hypothetical protein